MQRRYSLAFGLCTAILVLDQITKWAVRTFLPYGAQEAVVPGLLNLVHVRNRGAAFGFLNRADIQWQKWFFIAATLAAIGLMLYLLRKAQPHQRLLIWSMGLILGGAAGNLTDRVIFGFVTDFVDVYYRGWHWPAFNVADAAICVGAGLLAVSTFREQEHVPDAH